MKKTLDGVIALLQDIPGWVLALFSLSLVMMNLLANKSIDFGTDWLALDCGILVSWFAFLSMDLITIHYGPKASVIVSLLAMLFNLFAAAVFVLASLIPGTWGEAYTYGDVANTALNSTFAGNWFVLLGSVTAYVASSIANSFINDAIGKLTHGKLNFGTFAFRSYISTTIGQFIDNIIFALIVSHTLFDWSLLQCVTCAATGALAELLFEIIFSPFGYKIASRWSDKGKENIKCQENPQ